MDILIQELKGLKEMFIQARTKEDADELKLAIDALESRIKVKSNDN